MSDEWFPKSTAPRDGTVFWARNDVSGSVYETWFDEQIQPADSTTKFFRDVFCHDDAELGKWWCRSPDGRVTSFVFDVWQPKEPADG